MKNYVISLTTAHDRRTHITAEFGKQGIDFEFFDAITPDQVPLLAQKFNINIQNSVLTQGELACLFSHVCLWQKVIGEGLDYITVFEDDVYLGEDAKQFLGNYNWLPKECGLLKIEHFMESLYLGKSIHTFNNRQIKPLKECNWGTAGYIIHHYMINKMMNLLQIQFNKENIPIDHIMFDLGIKKYPTDIYQLSPALCIQSDRPHQKGVIESSLEHERKNKKHLVKKQKLSPLKKLYREIKRPFLQLILRFKYWFIHKNRQEIFFK